MHATDVRQTDVRRQTASSLDAPIGGGIITTEDIVTHNVSKHNLH